MAKVSIAIPWHFMDNWQFFLTRCLDSIRAQSFKDYEVVLIKKGLMAETSNAAMDACSGELIKILYMDDYFAHAGALQNIVDAFDDDTQWVATGCLHQVGEEAPHSPHYPQYTDHIAKGINSIGSPSVITVRNKGHLLFDEKLSWVLDCDLYTRYAKEYGPPKCINDLNVVMGLGTHQTTHKLTNDEKQQEDLYLIKKHV